MSLSRDLYLASRAGIIHYAALHYEPVLVPDVWCSRLYLSTGNVRAVP